MKLLITTQAIDSNDDHFVFFLDWVRAFALRYEKVTILALRSGDYTLPQNVEVLSLGKNEGKGRITYLLRFFKCIFFRSGDYDDVFVHMNPEYLVLGGWWWRLCGKKVGLWYTHKQVNVKLRVALFFANTVFTAVPESFRIPSKKVIVVGHGINTELFAPQKVSKNVVEILTVSRVAPIKHIEDMITILPRVIQSLGKEVRLGIVSTLPKAGERYFDYYQGLLALAKEKEVASSVYFLGAVSGSKLPSYYNHATITLNLTPTGGLDKAVLESLSCGIPVVASNQALRGVFGPFADRFLVELGNTNELAVRVIAAIKESGALQKELRDLVATPYSYKTVVDKICTLYETGR